MIAAAAAAPAGMGLTPARQAIILDLAYRSIHVSQRRAARSSTASATGFSGARGLGEGAYCTSLLAFPGRDVLIVQAAEALYLVDDMQPELCVVVYVLPRREAVRCAGVVHHGQIP
jgi:hypothetical protein